MIRSLVFLLAASLVAGCAGFDTIALGPTGANAPDTGVGGTGYSDVSGPDRDLDEGVGGTGFATGVAQINGGDDEGVGGTGIFGIISAFGSIVVNGVHIDYEDETPVVVDGVSGSPDDFAIGQVVAVEAQPMGERYKAHLVEVQHAAMGPVSHVDEGARTITVLGQTIQVASTDRLPLKDEWVRVSGLRGPDEQVMATRIDPVSPKHGAFVRGVAYPTGGEMLSLGGLLFDRPLIDGRTIEAGDEILLRGVVQARDFEVTGFVKAPREPFGGRMADLLVQGFVASNASGLSYVAGHNWMLPEGVSVRFSGDVLPAALFRGRWLVDEMSVTPMPRLQIPGLLRDMPWALEGDVLQAGDIPDLLRGHMDGAGYDPLTVDPTSLPEIGQVRALLAVKGMPDGFVDATRPLSADQLSALMELGGAEATEEGISRFNPDLFAAFLKHQDMIKEYAVGEGGGSSQMPQFEAMRTRLQEAGIDPTELAGARSELAAIAGLLRLRDATQQEGFDPAALPPGLRLRLRDILIDGGELPVGVPAALRPPPPAP